MYMELVEFIVGLNSSIKKPDFQWVDGQQNWKQHLSINPLKTEDILKDYSEGHGLAQKPKEKTSIGSLFSLISTPELEFLNLY